MKKFSLILISFCLIGGTFAQTYFKNFRDGESYFNEKDFASAITEFTKVVEAKKDHFRAFNYRGLCYEELGELDKSVSDFKKAVDYKAKEAEYHANLGRVYYKQAKYDEALMSLDLATKYDKKVLDVYYTKNNVLMALKRFQLAADNAGKAITVKKSAKHYYLKGVALDSLMNYKDAAYNFSRAVFYSSKMIEAHVGLAHTNLKLLQYEKAITSCNKALAIDGKSVQALMCRSEVYIENNNIQKAIDDISQIIMANPNEVKYYLLRAENYNKLGQYRNVITDYTKAIALEKDNYSLYYKRGETYEKLSEFKLAIKDYNKLKELAEGNESALVLYKDAKKRLHELNKESNNPKIAMINPVSPAAEVVHVAKNSDKCVVKGQIIDESNIAFVKVNGKDALFNKDTINPFFEVDISLVDVKEISITAFDVYQNTETWSYKIIETEVNAPVVKLMAPYASDDGAVYLESESPSLYIEGVIQDESLIKSIFIDGATASYVLKDNNPKFSATINIMNKDQFLVVTEDIYGNKTEKTFKINRENIALLADNPMGKTWVVFIENSDYKTFASIDGPTKDVTMMKSAFAKYKIHNIIHKKNLTKAGLEKFFSIELRDLVRSNKVNSLLVWYAGHGKFLNETGYWIPVNAKRDDEFTYFNIRNLKAAMNSYSKYITHTLVVTDACESGPSFYQAMRSTSKVKSCNDWKATKFKSSQVFSSAGYELASDNSQFTKTFANTLNGNPNSCIPIESIVTKVKTAVGKTSKQKPKFGKIAGLVDENGTFFFIKK